MTDFINPQTMIYGFAFGKGNVSAYTLWRLRQIDCCYQVFGEGSIDGYIETMLMREQPGFILGLGVYSGKDQDKIRIETVCTNKFRNGFMDGANQLTEVAIDPYLKPSKESKLAKGIGNSYCNMASWKILQKIRSGQLKSKYTFLHIPKSMRTNVAIKEIDQLLIDFRNLEQVF